jgi:predicted GH43/DUF377 family glycosyl hydrolase
VLFRSLWFTDGTRAQIGPKSRVALQPPGRNERRPAIVHLDEGNVSVAVAKAESRFAVRTPAATATATGTRFALNVAESGETALAVFSGSVIFSNSAGTVTASGAVRTTATANSAPTAPVGIGMSELLAGAPGRLRDSFDAPPLNEAVWILENINKGVLFAQQNGRLSIEGAPLVNAPGYRPRLLTYFFPREDFTASVNFRLGADAQAGAELDIGGSHAAFGAGVSFDPEQGYAFFDQEHLPPFGDERRAFHRLRLTYEAESGTLTGYVDDTEVGKATVAVPYFFLGFGATSGQPGTRIHVEFDDFEASFGGGTPLAVAVPPAGLALAEKFPGVVLDVGPPDAWDGLTDYNPSVLKRGGRYEMWYAADPPGGSWMGSSIGAAYSDDGITWRKHEANPVLSDGGAPCVLYRDWGDGRGPYYKMWYRHYQPETWGKDEPYTTLAYATSRDGIRWAKHGVIAGLRSAEGYGRRITSPSVLYLPKVKGLPGPYLLYYYSEQREVRMAVSQDGVHWAPWGTVLRPSASPGWDSYYVADAHVVYWGGKFRMFYTGNGADPRYGSAIGYAVSSDGVNWRRVNRLAVAGSNVPSSFDFGLVQPMPLLDGDEVKIWTVCGPYSGLFGFWGKNIGFARMPAAALGR